MLTQEARWVLAKYHPQVVAITGSVGKTSAKEATFAALAKGAHIRKSEKSLNSEIGVPLAVLGLETGWSNPLKWLFILAEGLFAMTDAAYPELLVLEVGADRPGDIRKIGSWLNPSVVVITGVPEVPVHVEYFGSPEAVADEKKHLARALREGGRLVLNGDDEHVLAMRSEFRAVCTLYGFDEGNDVRASHVQTVYDKEGPSGVRFRVNHSGSSVPFYVQGALGKTHVYPVLAACAVGLSLGRDLVAIGESLNTYTPAPGRMRLLPGRGGTTILDDTYNASPVAMHAALDALGDLKTDGRKIAVLGDMLELGKYSVEEHRKVGHQVAEIADLLVVVGLRARGIAQAAIEAGLPEARVRMYEQGEVEKVGEDLAQVLRTGDIVLAKGSQSMRMEKAVRLLLADSVEAKSVLARQDEAWLQR